MRLAVAVCFAACSCTRAVAEGEPPAPTAVEAVGVPPTMSTSSESAPLKQWMAANLARTVKTQDFEALARALSVLAESAPPELAGWGAIADRGAQAARDRDIDRVRQSCGDCHQTYRREYRERFQTRPFPLHATQGER
jgi:hypothetical protein